MNCPKCNTSNPEGSNFCKACGYDLKPLKDTNKKTKIWEKTWFRVLAIVVADFIVINISPRMFESLFFLYVLYVLLYLLSRSRKSTQPLKFVIGAIKIMIIGLACLSILYLSYTGLKDFFEKGNLLEGLTSIPDILLSSLIELVGYFFVFVVELVSFIGPGYLLLKKLEKKL
jgi:hypothetical protein